MSWFDKFRGSRSSGAPSPGRASRPGDERASNPGAAPPKVPVAAPPPMDAAEGPASSATAKFLARAGDLKAIPGMATRLLQLLDDPAVSANAIAQEVQRDQGLMAMVLRLANSAAYRSSGQVRDMTESIVVLGYDSLKHLVLGRLSKQVLRKDDDVQKALWRHALATALAAQACAREVRGITVAYAFTGGLLHDIGKAVMHEAFPDECTALWRGLSGLYPSDQVEQAQFGTNHTLIGAELLKQWQFPPMYRHAAGSHAGGRLPSDAKEKRLVQIVTLSGAVASWCGYDAAAQVECDDPHDHRMLVELAAAPAVVDQMRSHIEDQLQPLAAVFA